MGGKTRQQGGREELLIAIIEHPGETERAAFLN